VTAGPEFHPQTHKPNMNINWTFGINPVYIIRKEFEFGSYIRQLLSKSNFITKIQHEVYHTGVRPTL
jgi:hypothetical protein